jgi:hypothetical protein
MEQDPRYASRNQAKSEYANFLKRLRNQTEATRAAQNASEAQSVRKPPPPKRSQSWVPPSYPPPPKGGKRRTRKSVRRSRKKKRKTRHHAK